MAIKKKTKAQKNQDKKRLDKAQKKLFKAVRKFEQSVLDAEFNLDYILIKDITNMFKTLDIVKFNLGTTKETHVFDTYEDIQDIESDHISDIKCYKK